MDSRELEPVSTRPSLRQVVAPAHPDCLLTMGSQCLAAVLAEEWDAALNVLIQGSPLFWVEDTGILQTPEAEIAVRVSTIVRMESDEDELASSVPAFRIGLARLGQPVVKLPPQPAVPMEEARRKRLSLLPPTTTMGTWCPTWCPPVRISVGGLLAVALIVTPLLLVALAWRYRTSQAGSVDSQRPVAVAADLPSKAPPIQQQPAVPAVPEPTPEILGLPGVEPLLTPKVAKKLALTPSQTGAFGRLNKTTREALQDLEKYWENTGPLELARRRNVLLDAARQEALELLTDQQRQQWDAMTH